MDIKEIKNLLYNIEVLAVDTQPIRDFLLLYQSKKVNLDQFLHLFETLRVVLNTGSFSKQSSPIQIITILEQIGKKLETIDENDNVKTESNSKGLSDKDLIIFSTLMDIKKDLESIKSKDNSKINIIREVVKEDINHPSVQIDNVFVKPFIDDSNIKANIKVESKSDGNVNEKLLKLKKIKMENR